MLITNHVVSIVSEVRGKGLLVLMIITARITETRNAF